MQDSVQAGQDATHPAGQIETSARQDSVARAGALAGLSTFASEWFGACGIMPTSVSLAD